MNDRIGCLDTDGDGYSDADATWQIDSGATASNDSTQWSDFDEDGYGDNWGNDTWDDRNPQWPGQYVEGATSQDACPTQPGSSTEMMIYGCIDRDDDGWSDSWMTSLLMRLNISTWTEMATVTTQMETKQMLIQTERHKTTLQLID